MRKQWWAEAQREQRAFEAWQNRLERPLARKVARSKSRLVRGIAELYALSPDSSFSLLVQEHEKDIESALIEIYARVIPRRAQVTLDSINKKKRWPQYESYFERLIALWTQRNALAHAQMIAGTTMDDVRNVIERGVVAGKSSAAVGRDIRKLTAFSAWRAVTVARTEIHNAALFAQDEIAKQAEVDFGIQLMKFWIPTLDSRTRDAHAAMSSHEGVPTNGKFLVGGVLMERPGDPNGGAANVVNCRCGLVHRELEIE